MLPQSPNPESIPFPVPAVHGVEIISHGRKIHMYSVTDTELNSLQDSGLSATIDVALFTLSVGVFSTSIVTISTVDISDAKVFASYIAAAIVTALSTIYFGLRSRAAWRNAKNKLREIKNIT
jgi:hypothetical protein